MTEPSHADVLRWARSVLPSSMGPDAIRDVANHAHMAVRTNWDVVSRELCGNWPGFLLGWLWGWRYGRHRVS